MANNFGSDANCVALWRFESGALLDDSKGTNTLTSNGIPVASSTHVEGSYSVDTDVTLYLYRTDANLSSDFPLKSGTSNKTFTMATWVYPYSFSTISTCIVSKLSAAPNNSFAVFRQNNGNEHIWVGNFYDGTNAEWWDTGLHMPNLEQWYHIGISYNDSTKYCSVVIWDGASETTANYTFTNNFYPASSNFEINAYGTSYPARALYDEFVVFKTALSDANITKIRQGTYGANVFLTTYVKDKILDHILKTAPYTPLTPYLALFTASPGPAGGGTEANYTGYTRKAITFGAANARAIAQNAAVNFPTATAGSNIVTHWGIMDADAGGNVLVYGSFIASKTVTTDKRPVVASGEVIVAFKIGGLSTAYANAILDWLLRGQALAQPTNIEMALCSTACTDASLGTELSGNGYLRETVNVWDVSASGASENTNAVTFDQATAQWDVVSGALIDGSGNYMYGISNLTVASGSYGRYSAGAIDIVIAD